MVKKGGAKIGKTYRVRESASFAKKKFYEKAGLKSKEAQDETDKLMKALGVLGTGVFVASSVVSSASTVGAAVLGSGVLYVGGKAAHKCAKKRAPNATKSVTSAVSRVGDVVKNVTADFTNGAMEGMNSCQNEHKSSTNEIEKSFMKK